MRTGCICLMVTVLGSFAAPGPDSQDQSSWLESLMSSLGGKRSADPLPGAEFWGVRGKRGAAPQVEALDQQDKRSLKPNSLFGSLHKRAMTPNSIYLRSIKEYLKRAQTLYGEKMMKPNSLFSSMGKRTLKPNSLFGAIGKRTMKPNSLFGAIGKKSLKPNSLFGSYGKRSFKPNGLFSMGRRAQLKPNGLFAMSKRSIMPVAWLLEEEEGDDVADFDNEEAFEDEDDLEEKRSFWAARGKRAGLEGMEDFFATRGRRADEVPAPAFDFFAARG